MDFFLIKLILSFLVGGSYIAFTLWLSEKFGSKIGGILIGLPSTVLISLIFIAWTQNTESAIAASVIIPAIIGIDGLFAVTFIFLYKHGFFKAFCGALLVWALLSFPIVLIHLNDLGYSLGIGLLFFLLSLYLLRGFPHKVAPPKGKSDLIFRVVFAGGIISTAVLIANILGPLWGGLFASFPAIFSSSLILLSRKHGFEFTASVARSMVTGSLASIMFPFGFYILGPTFGLIGGLLLAYGISLITSVVVYLLDRSK